jgi:hypothetical protein
MFSFNSTSSASKYVATWCMGAAIQASLNAAPGIDPSSPAALHKAEALKTKKINGESQYELFAVMNSDQSDKNVDRVLVVSKVTTLNNGNLSVQCKILQVKATN